jgi:iron complex outermembrane receptor protein
MQNASGEDSIITDPESALRLNVFKFDQHNAYLYGAELHIDVHPHPLDWLHFENTFSYTRGLFNAVIDGSKNIPDIPAAKWISELRGNFLSKHEGIKNLYISVTADYTFQQDHPFTGFNTETPTDSYLLLNTGIGTDVSGKNKTLFSIHFSVLNLANIAYQNHLSRLKYTDQNNVTGRTGIFEEGRNFSIKVDVPLNFKI